jgi:hypothetical protein
MDTLTIILLATAGLGLVALVWLSGYELGMNEATASERALANHRINGILREHAKDVVAYENARKPKSAKCRRKAARKAVPA